MTTTGNDLTTWVDEQITATGLEDEVGLLVLAALEGDAELDDHLERGSSRRRPERARSDAVDPAGGSFLRAITVEGFRGIGERVTLPLQPRPGLTIVAGRNGSGKSSLSEALELVLTGDTYRWRKSSVAWKQSWRNLHHPRAAIEIDVVEESTGPLSLRATWPDGEGDVTQAAVKTQRPGAKQYDGMGQLGWQAALEQYRPILSYDELGGLLEGKPSELYDSLAGILGVEQLTDALKRVQARHKDAKAPLAAATARRKALQQDAGTIDDERARQAAALLKKSSPDLDALRALVTGTSTTEQGPVHALRLLTNLPLPFPEDGPATAAAAIRRTTAALADVQEQESARLLARLELLEHALEVHAEHGDMTCPVCRTGTLDARWRADSTQLADTERRRFDDLRVARQDLDVARGHARRLLAPVPPALQQAPVPELEEAVAAARAAWQEWAAAPSGDSAEAAEALATHLESRSWPVAARVTELREAAGVRLAELEDVWRPFATQLGAWCDDWERCQAEQPIVGRLAAAEQWLKGADLRRKNERLERIAGGAKAVWSRLRQESNVEIGALSLTGTGTRRRLQIDASVDGSDDQDFTVLSQGELHALALALFLPRATMPESPFRFLVIDDPVQAMDPAKVDGLVSLLGELARTHQVVVLSHDDRLPAAVRRSQVNATVLEVTRGTGSQVSIAMATDPAQRYLDDAFALVREWEEGRLEESAMRRTLPGMLRFAVEAAAKDRYFTQRLTTGVPLAEVEAEWEDAATTRQKVILAVFGEPRENSDLDRWASAPYRRFGLRTIGTAMHSGLKADLDPRDAVRDVERLVKDLREGAK